MGSRSGQRFAALRARFDEWRQGPRRRRIPEALWGAAVQIAREHGVWQTSRELKLDYYALKRRVTKAARRHGQSPSMKFVEVAPKILGVAPACVVEMHDPTGRRLRVELREAVGAAEVAQALWKASR
jgi:hypothetical protein